jgi:hypothetical protein
MAVTSFLGETVCFALYRSLLRCVTREMDEILMSEPSQTNSDSLTYAIKKNESDAGFSEPCGLVSHQGSLKLQ